MSSKNQIKEIENRDSYMDMTLEGGYSYLIKENENDAGVRLLSHKELVGDKILYITRTPPELVNNKNNLSEDSTIWLTFNKGPNCIEPTNITRLSMRIQKFLKENKQGTILFDGLEYLTSQNDFSTILHFIQLVNDKIMISDSKLILSVNPSAFKEKELALIEREMESLSGKVWLNLEAK
jgi:hypothetical protein